ncbi:MAG: antibiotic biosynthesis monooxygenase [Bacteroidota bacterium]
MELKQPYYAVIFTNTRTEGDDGYAEMAEEMERLAREQPGFLGFESARSSLGISVSYWKNLESISRWRSNIDHKVAQRKGKTTWYSWYKVRVCTVDREYEFTRQS